MGTILIDKLLAAQVKQGASDLHITVGQPPVLRLHGHLQKLKTKVLEPADTMGLMKSITPDRCQQEFQESGSTDFGFAFGDAGIPEPYFYVTAYPLPDALPGLDLPDGTAWQSDGFSGAVLLYRRLLEETNPEEYLVNLWSGLLAAGRQHMLDSAT